MAAKSAGKARQVGRQQVKKRWAVVAVVVGPPKVSVLRCIWVEYKATWSASNGAYHQGKVAVRG